MSKFAGLFDQPKPAQKKFSKSVTAKNVSPPVTVQDGKAKKLGRPAEGKRSNPDYMQGTVYLRKSTRDKIDDALKKDNRIRESQNQGKRDFSDLVEDLLTAWLKDSRI